MRNRNLRHFLALALWLSGAAFAESEQPRFVVEYSKNPVWEGEQVHANFVLYALDDALEVEVEKFPQFRGFWSENVALRQGPIPLLRDSFKTELRRAVVGTYIITAMRDRAERRIEPMKLLVKPLLGGEVGITFASDVTPLVMKKLPPVPADLREGWTGAVGMFSLQSETTMLRFHLEEPVVVRYLLNGEGNFPEINSIPFRAPEGFKILSARALSQSVGGFGSKVFEWTLLPESAEDRTIGPLRFPYFNPTTNKYETRESTPIVLAFEPKTYAVPGTGTAGEERFRYDHWSAATPAWRRPLFLAANAALLVFFGSLFALRLGARRRDRRRADPRLRARDELRRAKVVLQRGDADLALRVAEEALAQWASQETTLPASAREAATQVRRLRHELYFRPPGERAAVPSNAEIARLFDEAAKN